MTAPSSPVPTVERIELPGGWYFQQVNPPHGVIYALRTPKGKGFGINGTGMSVGLPVVQAFAAAMSTPTPGRAAEPDPTPKASVAASEAGRVGESAASAYAFVKKIDLALHDAIGITDAGGPLCKRLEAIHSDVHDLAVAVAALRDGPGEWQDISTVPQTGDVLLWLRATHARVEIARWDWRLDCFVSPDEMTEFGRLMPTHWRPLPPPPAQITTTTKDRTDGQ